MKSEERAKKAVSTINTFKQSHKDFTKDELEAFLRANKAPYWNRIVTILKKSGQIKTVAPGLYGFCFQEPVLYRAIMKEMDAVCKANADSVAKCLANKTGKTATEKKSAPKEISLSEAITLLKKHGYRILKPRTEYDEL